MTKTFFARLPLPPVALSPNRTSHAHWRYRHAATGEYRMTARSCFNRDKPRDWVSSHVQVAMHYFCCKTSDGYRPKDVQNAMASIKAGIDGMVDANIVPDDSRKWVSWDRLRLYTTSQECAGAQVGWHVEQGGVILVVTRA